MTNATTTKAKRGAKFDKVKSRVVKVKEKYMIIAKGIPNPELPKILSLSKAATSVLETAKDDDSFIVLTGYQNDPLDIPDISFVPAGKEEMLRLSIASLSAHFLEPPAKIYVSKSFGDKVREELLQLAMTSMYGQVEDFAA